MYTNFKIEKEGAAWYEHGVQDPFEWILGMKTKHFIDDCASLFLIHNIWYHHMSILCHRDRSDSILPQIRHQCKHKQQTPNGSRPSGKVISVLQLHQVHHF